MRNRKMTYCVLLMIGMIVMWLFHACAPVREFMHWKTFNGIASINGGRPAFNPAKKTVIIIADNEGTEIFDLMAPYYLFNATEKANVYIVARDKTPVILRKGLFLMPDFSFGEFDSMGIHPQVIVIPNLSAMDARHQNQEILGWIKKQYRDTTFVLSVCDGALTAAATGIYDGKPLTTHASDFAAISKQFNKPLWVNNIRVTQSGRLFSTAGVSNATDGALSIIDTLFGRPTMLRVSKMIHYALSADRNAHKSIAIDFGDKAAIGKKVLFGKNRQVGVLLQDGANELELAAVLDTYNRTFPKSLESISLTNQSIRTGYGLTLFPTASLDKFHPTELHVLCPDKLPSTSHHLFDPSILVKYEQQSSQYIIDVCLSRIRLQYGLRYTEVVKRLLDYN
ncbi:DJ-1/PfpI family protein [Chitinophaga dinghuensis]|uniref:DJ-1/PfpI family protein n=1 Tax=Chitinophaga dinghuensis TaxID=1539050 RepID=UPI0014738E03|nr:DJ-1/PfpI family protein [Chitinophaga dinghuensis]